MGSLGVVLSLALGSLGGQNFRVFSVMPPKAISRTRSREIPLVWMASCRQRIVAAMFLTVCASAASATASMRSRKATTSSCVMFLNRSSKPAPNAALSAAVPALVFFGFERPMH